MFNYARSDTHFLLYIYDNLRNELIDKSDRSEADRDLIEVVMDKSRGEALQRYERPLYDSERGLGVMGWYPLLCRTPALFNREQFAVFRAVHHWRDSVAREEDESVHTIIPKQILYTIAKETPIDEASLYGCLHPMSQILFRKRKDLLRVIQQAKSLSANGPDMKDYMQTIKFIQVECSVSAAAAPEVAPTHPDPIQEYIASKQLSLLESKVRSESSVFWGLTVMDTRSSQGPEVRKEKENLRLALPLPQLTAEIFEEANTLQTWDSATQQTNSETHVEHEYVRGETSQIADAFALKEVGGSRKRKAFLTEDDRESISATVSGHVVESADQINDASEVSLSGQHAERDEKKRVKKAKKEAQRLEKVRQADIMIRDDGPRDVEAFDYANAPSVLHTKRSGNDLAGHKFADPYSKSMNAPKGMRRTKTEVGGKSFTFKK